ncbi:MAG: flippase-like domain-containing protein [Chitinispirillaceae bacterium]|nr:flippase-like domain-containing protein [Chitinispirillaceae bacterium]
MKKNERNSGWITAVQVIATIIAVVIIVAVVDIKAIMTTVAGIGAATLALVGIMYVGATFLKACRLKMCGLRSIGLFEMVFIVWLQSCTNHLIPGRIGDGVVLFLTGRKKNTGWMASGIAVLLTLFADVSALIIMLAVALPFSGLRVPGQPLVITAALFAVPLAWTACAFLAGKSRSAKRIFHSQWLERAMVDAGPLLGFKNSTGVILLSLVLGTIAMTCNFLILKKMNVDLHFWQAIVACSALPLISLLPIQPVGGWGVFEAALIPGLGLFGIPPSDAFALGVSMHLVNYIYFIPLGVTGYVFFFAKRRTRQKLESDAP